MFCRNCGEQLPSEQAEICVKCGVKKGNGDHFCMQCGAKTDSEMSYCLNCGAQLNAPYKKEEQKSRMTAGLLGILIGGFGAHNFYLGYTTKAVIQVSVTGACILLACCTGGLTAFGSAAMGIWGLVEGIMILGGTINVDGKGVPLI